jgi:hypothetical protein
LIIAVRYARRNNSKKKRCFATLFFDLGLSAKHSKK